jgi:regulator of protease activity HflC (stomatin/prohibitin superfamily)
MFWTSLLIGFSVIFFLFLKVFIVVEMREEALVERLGKFLKTLKPGLHFLIPIVDRVSYRQEMREQVIDVPSQGCITKDNIEVQVDGLLYIKVMDSYKASYGIGNYALAAVNLAQTNMRSEIGRISLDETFSEREMMNENIVREIDKASDPWGIKVLRYEIRNIRPSLAIIETLEKQMEAERAKRADILRSSGQKDAVINISKGDRQAAVLHSEADKIRQINEADGKAAEVRLIADATAKGITRMAMAIEKKGGLTASHIQILEQFTDSLGDILETTQVTVLPTEVAKVKTAVEGMTKLVQPVKALENLSGGTK